jgi:hypothetical protein
MVDFADERPLLARPGLGRITWVFVRYGNFTLGGGSATAATLHRALVERRNWLTEDQFTLCFALVWRDHLSSRGVNPMQYLRHRSDRAF